MAPRRILSPALLTFLVTGLFSASAFAVLRASADRNDAIRFEREVTEIENALRSRWAAQEQVLRSGVAFMEASTDGVDWREWRTFVEGLDLARAYPGIQGVGWAVRVDPEDLAEHESRYRALLGERGYGDYEIHPVPGNQSVDSILTSIVYLEPLDERNRRAIALDMYSEPNRRTAMQRAWETGAPALSGKILLVQETETDQQAGFLLYLPVFDEAGLLRGWVYSPFRARDLMNGILGSDELSITFEVYDGTEPSEASLMFDANGRRDPAPSGGVRSAERVLDLAGRAWTIRYVEAPGFTSAVESRLPAAVLGFGLLISLLLSTIVWSLGRTRARAIELADSMTHDLRRSQEEKSRLTEELLRSNADLEEFAYVASHDLQEPARTTQAYLGLLEADFGDRLGEEARENLSIAKNGAARMQEIIRDLLDYSRAARLDVADAGRVDLEATVSDAVVELRRSIQDAGARVDVVRPLPDVAGDPPSVRRVVLNLVSNAIKYRSAERPLVITVRAEATSEGMILVSVEDNGIGVPVEQRERIFQMHVRLHRRDDIPGNGMGLAICRQVVERLGGRIRVDGRDGPGSAFRFTLPRWGAE